MRTRSVATLALLAALAAGCGDEPIPTTDPGHTPTSETPSETPSEAPSETPASTPAATAAEAGPAFVAFAGGGPLPPAADRVEVYLGNALTGVLTRRQARERSAWATCTELGDYAGRGCPLSPLTVLRGHDQVAYAGRPRGDCLATYGPVPPDLRRLERTVVVPAPDSVAGCADEFAIQLFTDGGRLVAVSTLLGEP